jgi:hypothetical protein
MKMCISLATAAALAFAAGSAVASELPSYAVAGFPISPGQFSVLVPANVRERAPAPTLTLSEMPASPHQIAVLMPHPRPAE